MRLSVVVHSFNEAAVIAATLAAPVENLEIIVVDDASFDGTRKLLTGALRSEIDLFLLHDRSRGKGASLRTGTTAGLTRRERRR